MNQNNLNNKFGECCNCPALSTGKQYFTNYVSSRLYDDNLRKKLNINNSNTYRSFLQLNGTTLMSTDTSKSSANRCKSNATNKFYIDSSKFNFSSTLKNEYLTPNPNNHYIIESKMSNF
jgi:hypothetical protein